MTRRDMASTAAHNLLSHRSHGLEIVELWFDEELPPGARPDIIRHTQAPAPVGAGGTDFFTLVNDLSLDEGAMLAAMDKDTRYEVRRAEQKDALVAGVWDGVDPDWPKDLVRHYDDFARQKDLPAINAAQLWKLADAGRLDIARIRDKAGKTLVYHSYYRHRDHVRLLHSASHFRGNDDTSFRAMVGRANRLLHWLDMRRFKADGLRYYDWGGWYEGREDQSLLRINAFKEGFGGAKRHMYNGERLITAKARLFARVARMLGKR